jgi:hypothetical protein
MEKGTLAVLLVAALTLIAVLYSHVNLTEDIAAIGAQEGAGTGPEVAVATSITTGGVGDRVDFTSGGGNCNPASATIEAEASISGGAMGNTITATASCSLSNFQATTTSTDPGTGASAYTSNTANPGRGRATCTTAYSAANGGVPDSHWVVVCTF